MGFFELLFISVGLSMDAFAVAICQGLSFDKFQFKKTFWIALYFGGFQALMSFLGWALGSQFEKYIVSVDHWISFALLSIIGVQMILEAKKNQGDLKKSTDKVNHKELLILAIATSIDALTVGITFAFLGVDIVVSVSTIGICTFLLSALGVVIGYNFGNKLKSKAEIFGGFILILIGLKILLEHLEVIT